MAAKIPLRGSIFVPARIGAGAGDALARAALVHDVVTSAFDTAFCLPDYRNYHSPELDFLEILGLRAAFSDRETQSSPSPEVQLDLTTLVQRAVGDGPPLLDGHRYIVSVSASEKNIDLTRFRARFDLRRNFFSKVRYTPSRQVFDDRPGVVKAVLHLRRNDICGAALFAGTAGEAVPEKVRYGIQSLPLLTVAEAMHLLEAELAPGTPVDVVLASDGFGNFAHRFRAYPAVLERLERLEEELRAPPVSDVLQVRLVARLIGRDADVTRHTLDAMHAADVIVTSRPAFPRLVARSGRTRLIVVQP
jgi:hypothetical protein